MFDVARVSAIAANVQSGLVAIGNKSNNINHEQLTEAYYLVKNEVLAFKGDAAHDALNVLQDVAHGNNNLDRHHARDCGAAMASHNLTLVAA